MYTATKTHHSKLVLKLLYLSIISHLALKSNKSHSTTTIIIRDHAAVAEVNLRHNRALRHLLCFTNGDLVNFESSY